MNVAYDVRVKSNGDYWKAHWRDAKGEPRSKSLGPKSRYGRRQAEAMARQLAVDLRLGVSRDGVAPRLSEWLRKYLELRTDLAESTRKAVEHTGRYLLAYFTADPPIDRVTRLDAASWKAALARGELRKANLYPKSDDQIAPLTRFQTHRKRMSDADKRKEPRPLSASSVVKHVRDARRIFEEATEENGVGLIGKNPFRRLAGTRPKPAKDWAFVSHEDLGRILDACPNDGWRALFALCRLAGLRRGEALDLMWRDVLWDQNRLVINARLERETTKKAKRMPPIEPARAPTGLTALLAEIHARAPEGAERVCAGVEGKLHRRAVEIIQRAGVIVYKKPFHCLRKNRCGEIARVFPQHVFKEWMGHDPEVAEQFYLRVEGDYYAAPNETQTLGQKEAQTAPVTRGSET